MSREQHKERIDQITSQADQLLEATQRYRALLEEELAQEAPGSQVAVRLGRLAELTDALSNQIDEDFMDRLIRLKDLVFALEEMRSGRFF